MIPYLLMRCHNNWNLTYQAIKSILELTKQEGKNYYSYKLIVVDDGSTDGTEDELVELQRENPCMEVIIKARREGSPAALNTGLTMLWKKLDHKSVIIILDNDIEIINKDWLDDMLEYFKESLVGCVGAISDKVGGLQNVSSPLSQYNLSWLVSFCCAIKGNVIKKVGLFDTRFGMGNSEDTDYGIRIIEAGYKMRIARDVFIKHHCHSTFSQLTDLKELLKINKMKFLEKHGERKSQLMLGG